MLILTATITVITINLWLSKLTNNAEAAPPIQTEENQVNTPTQIELEDPVTDLVVDDIEVTQSMQDLNNSVPLVMGKRTFVRVYVHSTNGIYPTTALLKVQIGGWSTKLLPIPPGGPFINVRHVYTRLLPSHAFLFEIPFFYTFGTQVTLTAEVNPAFRWHPHNPEEYSYDNNTIIKTISFDPVPPLTLVIASQPYMFNKIKFAPNPLDQWSLFDWINRVYPLNKVKLYFRTLPTINAYRELDKYGNWVLIYPNCSVLNSYLAYDRVSVFGSPFFPDDTAFYAMVADDSGFMRGCSPIGGKYVNLSTKVRVASGPSGNSDWGWDYDGTYADWYGGHELGHAFSQSHVKGGPGYVKDGCGGEAYAGTHNPNGRISPTLNFYDPTAVFGFDRLQLDLGKNPILSPYWHDLMTYCDYQWMSQITDIFLKHEFEDFLPLAPATNLYQTTTQDALAIFGELNQTTRQLSLQPIFILFNVPDIVPPTHGDYAIVLRDADGGELARYSFSPYGIGGGPSPDPSQEIEYSYISELVPNVTGTTSLEIEDPGGNILAQVTAGPALPTVQVTSPNRGSIEDGDTVTVTWTASDPDGDLLTFNVDYSSDNGVSWEPAGLFYTDTQAIIDQTNLPAGNLALMRVSASDGIHTTQATSDPFTVPNRVPTGQIIEPSTDVTIAVSQTVTFEGQVYDIDLGNLDDTNIEWSSNIDGFVGNGAIYNTDSLSVGVHTITMTADDGQGGVITDQVIVTVVPTPNDLPAQPDALSVGPEPVFLLPSSGVITATVYVDNLNLGNSITWDAFTDSPWLHLSAVSGSTPDELTISADIALLDFGTYTAMLTFTSPQVPGDRATLRVVLTIPHYALFLPFTMK